MTQTVWTRSAQSSKGWHRKHWQLSTTSLFIITGKSFHWSDLKLLCTTGFAEASFSLAANFLAEAQQVGLGELFHNAWHWSLGVQRRLQVIQVWHHSAWFGSETSLGYVCNDVSDHFSTVGHGPPWTCWSLWDLLQKDDTLSSMWPVCTRSISACCWLTDASTTNAHVSGRGYLSMWWSPTGGWCHLGSPQD